ncbi:ExeM/NucH family extracellular endonuclease [Nocardioides alcanivorans]|uniref:ExeM/NucH family extracellular endonuclease n=1 Tax=Nocardioides alcanivorans TaxID=2897352 RepID=UPI001F3109EF|nr:ExeM/NucH family extracellular endonuclease [Nocardioides alcanivorans]
MSRHKLVAPLAVAALTAATLAAVPTTAQAAPVADSALVISEVYGGGGNSGAPLNQDFVELHNKGDVPIDLTGYSVQYKSAAGAVWTGRIDLSGTLAPGDYYLAAGATGANGGPLPTPDVVNTGVNLSGTTGNVALSSSTTTLTCVTTACAADPAVVDLVGFGGGDTFLGTAPAPAPSNSTSVARDVDSSNTLQNVDDFTAGAPTPGEEPAVVEPPEEVELTIPEIQGTGLVSDHVGDIATTTGVVTAAYPAGGLFGFYLQTPGTGGATDVASRTASDGIFVRVAASAGAVTVQPGDHVQVKGAVAEYAGATQVEVTAAADIVPLDDDADPVTPVTLEAWPSAPAEREVLEGMLFQPTGDFTVTNTYFGGSNPGDSRYGEVGLAQGDKPLMTPTEVADAQDAAAVAAVEADNAARQVVLDDGSSWSFFGGSYDGNGTPAYVSQSQPAVVGASVTFDEPVVFTEGGSPSAPTWRFQPTSWVQGPDNTTSPVTFENTRTPAPEAAQIDPDGTADVRVASFNVLNYFTTLGDADDDNVGDGGCTAYNDRNGDGNNVNTGCAQRGAWDPEDLERQQNKIVAAINALDADVVGLMEIENSAALGEEADEATETLVAALNADAGDEVWAANPSSEELPDASEQDVITNAIIYKVASVERVGEAHALGDQSSGSGAFANAREPIAQTFRSTDGGDSFLVVVNHFKSKGSGADDGTGQGAANPDRIAQAEALRDWVPSVQASEDVEAVLLTGDFNAYTMEDPLQVLYDAGYADAATEFGSGDEWTYSFQAMSGSLDHVLLNEAAQAATTGADIWGINSGESLLFEYSRWNYHATDFHEDTPYRSSDHDPVLVGLDLVADDSEPEPVKAQKAVIKAKFKPAKLKVGKNGKIVVTVKGKQGAKATGKVKIKVKGKVTGKKTITVKLNKNGKAKIKLPKAKKVGKLQVAVKYLGSDAVKAGKKKFKVKVVRKK